MDHTGSLILLRGNSGSGKTTTARALQKKFGHGTMVISQDVIRREMLYVNDGPTTEACQLLIELAAYGKKHSDVVIIEGILNSKWYRNLFEYLLSEFGSHIHAFYFDLPFEETLNRHRQKPNAHEFGEKEMRAWWNEKDLLDNIHETCLSKELSLNEIVDMVYRDVTAAAVTVLNDTYNSSIVQKGISS